VLGHRLPHTREHSTGVKGAQGGGERGRYPYGMDGATPTPSGGMLADCLGFLSFAPIDNLARGA
jgi:hypothetical protein